MDEQKKKAIKRVSIVFFCMALLLISVIGFLLPLRPDTSTLEKRSLTAFPEFSLSALVSGEYFSQISLWYADTFPLRDTLVEMNNTLGALLGTDAVKNGFHEGVTGDEIPEAPSRDEQTSALPETTAVPEETTLPVQTTLPETTLPETTLPETTLPETTISADTAAQSGQKLENIFIYGNAGYEYYNFVKSTADSYVSVINRASELLYGRANVYAMIIPTSIDIMLDSQIRDKLSVSDQKKAIDYMYGSMSGAVRTVNLYDTLFLHRNEYIYFRTDHHWTGLGAYYAYRELCGAKGVTALDLSAFTLQSVPGFLGSFYNDSGMSPALGNTPDTVDAYYPPYETVMTVTDKNGETKVRPLIFDSTNSQQNNKYACFIYGDNPFTVIENKSSAAGESCLLVKESFGNAFAPYLCCLYKYVYVVDYRYCEQTVNELVNTLNITDVIYCNNISMTRSKTHVENLIKNLE